jgi:predicted anti-sigma-YlaC factor YlaD
MPSIGDQVAQSVVVGCRSWATRIATTAVVLLFGARCASLQTIAINKLGDSLAKGGSTFTSDDDPELVGDALPFSLKLMESLLAESPRHPGLLLASARGFTQYAYGWVEQPATERANDSLDASVRTRERARRLYLRACRYGLRGLESAHPRFEARLRATPHEALLEARREDVPLLYWTAAAWALAISNGKDQPDLVADLPQVEAMIDRALELDEAFDRGAIHVFLISYEPNRAGGVGDPIVRSRRHFDRAVELSHGTLAAPFVTFAETISVSTQRRAEFEELLHRALAIDPASHPESRMENQLAQRHAQWLLAHAGDLFLAGAEGETK